MDAIKITAIDSIEHYTGPHEIPGIRFRPARKALGVTAWGMNVVELDPGNEGYPDHDHEGDGQEEVYVVLRGSAVLVAGTQEFAAKQGDMVRVPPGIKRKWVTRGDGAQLLAIGATPGRAYEIHEGM